MNEKVKKVLESIKAFWGKFSKKAKIIILSVAGAVIVGAIVLTVLLNGTKYVVLYPSLDSSEAREVVAEIEDRGIDYKEDGGTIYVPEAQEESLRMDLANQGHPYSTYNYDFFLNNVDSMTTDAERKIIEKYQLSQKLESVISTIDCIDRATVTINLAEKSNYVISNDNKSTSSAGVTLTIKKGKELSANQVSGIKTLIAKSVPNLDAENVSIIDTATGIELGSNSSIEVDKSTLKLSLQAQYENDVENKVRSLLSTLLDEDKFQVVARSNIDVDKGVKEIITYTPSQDNRGVINHEEHNRTSQGDGTGAGGVPGTDTNVGTTTYSNIKTDDNTIYVDSSDTYDYLVSQMKEQIQKDSAEIVSLNVSVVLKDSSIDETQKNEIAKLVANSAGIAENKVVVYNGASVGTSDTTPANNPNANANAGLLDSNFILILSIVGGVMLIALILLFIVLRRARKKRKRLEEELLAAQNQPVDIMEDPSLEDFKIGDITDTKETKAEALKNQIQNFAGENPEIAAQLVRAWIKGEDDINGNN